MIDFHRMMNRTEDEVKLNNMRLRSKLANVCLESCKGSDNINSDIYCAYTHLHQISELGISEAEYDELQFTPPGDMNYKAYAKAKEYLKKLDALIAEKEVEGYNAIHK